MVFWTVIADVSATNDQVLPNGDAQVLQSIIPLELLNGMRSPQMPESSTYASVAKATVSILGKGGQGVLVNDELIITAAHCISYSLSGGMVLGNLYLEKIRIHEREFTVRPLAVEPVLDIAILGSLDGQDFPKEASDFLTFYKHADPVPVCRSDFALGDEYPVHIYTHKGTWVTGTATNFERRTLSVETDEQIESGTSGGPIINDSGELVGVVSNFTDIGEGRSRSWGTVPYPPLALPVWVCRRIFGE